MKEKGFLNVFDYIKSVQGQKATKEPDTVSEPVVVNDLSHTDSDAGASSAESDREDEEDELPELEELQDTEEPDITDSIRVGYTSSLKCEI